MKQQIVKLNYLRIAPRKVRLVADAIRKLSANEAEALLFMMPKKAGHPVLKLLRSAITGAKHNQQIEPERLFVKEIKVDQAPILKRIMPRARGQAGMIHKKGSHITLVLEESDKLKPPRFNIVKPERIKKSEMAKLKKEQKDIKEEKPKEALRPDTKKIEARPKKSGGIIKKMFRRKSI